MVTTRRNGWYFERFGEPILNPAFSVLHPGRFCVFWTDSRVFSSFANAKEAISVAGRRVALQIIMDLVLLPRARCNLLDSPTIIDRPPTRKTDLVATRIYRRKISRVFSFFLLASISSLTFFFL